MPNLLDAIRQNTGNIATQQQGVTDESSKLQTLLRAKSGKDVGGGDATASNLGEQQAVASANNTMQNQIAPAAQIQQAGVEQQASSQQQSADLQKADISQSRKFDNINTRIKTNQILQGLEQNKGQIDQAQRDSQVAQAAQNLRLQNQQYISNLQREGQRSRLDNENSFNQEIAASTFADNQELLEKSLGNKSILDANDRDFNKAMGQMSAENAYEIFRNDMKAEKERGMYQAIGGLATAAVGAAGKMPSGSSSNASPGQTMAGGDASSMSTMEALA